MSENTIQLKTSSVINLPLQTYSDEFTFIVNGKEFKTTRLISDLLSPKISQYHQNDPTINKYEISTANQGDFSTILDLVNFRERKIEDNEIPFLSEIIENLKINTIELILKKYYSCFIY